VSFTTRPPGDVSRATPPVAPTGTATGASASTGATPGVTPVTAVTPVAATPAVIPTSVRPGTIDAAGALRVFVEEVRASAQTQLVAAARAANAPPLADADPGNAAAALLRWLRAAVSEAPVPASALREVVERAYARTAETLQRAAAAAPPAARADGATPQDVLASAREALASARDLVLRGLGGRAASPQTRAAATGGVPDEVPVAASRSAAPRTDGTRVDPVSAERGARPAAMPSNAGMRGADAAATPPPPVPRGGAPAVAAPPSSPAVTPAAPRVDPIAALRTFVDAIRTELQRTVGPGRMPTAPPPLVTDPRGESLAPALLRWLTSAVAERGVSLAPLQDAVRSAFARVDAALAATGASTPEATAAIAQARDALAHVRDQVLRGLGASPERDDRAAVRVDAPAVRGDVRVEPGVVDARGVPVPVGAASARTETRDERVEPVEARRAERTGRELAPLDDAPGEDDAAARRDGADVQGPMDCVRRYFDAFLAGDSVAYAAQWVYPACVWSDGAWSAYPDARACAVGNDAYIARLRLQGIVGGRIVMLRVEPTSTDAALVHGVFTRERADGTVVAEVEAAYTTVRTDAGWRVAVCIVKRISDE
jgi:hypothetical protein